MITTIVLNPAVDKVYFVDGFQAGGLYRVRNTVKSAGGKGINVARVAASLGETVSTIGFKAGGTGEWLQSELQKLGVHTDFIEVKGESRTNNNIVDRTANVETELLETGPFVTCADMDKFLDSYRCILKDTTVLVCSGGLPEGVPTNFYRTLADIAKSCGVKFILDTSNEMLEEGIEAKPYMVKPNLRELGAYVKKQLKEVGEIIEACRYITSKGVELVAASMGKDGALLVSEDVVLYAEPPDISVVNTIGSGDSMAAGFAVGLSRGHTMEEMLRLGMACAVANTQFMEIGVVSRELVENYLKEIRIREIS